MAMKQDKRYIKTEKTIRSEFLSMLETMNYDEITVDKLCQNAIISKNTFYAHYRNKDELVDKIENELIEGLIDFFKKVHLNTDTNGFSFLEKDVEFIFNYIKTHYDLFCILFKNDSFIHFSVKLEMRLKMHTLGWTQMLSGLPSSKLRDVIILDYMNAGMVRMIKDYVAFHGKISHEEFVSIAKQAMLKTMKDFTDSAFNITL